MKNSRFKFSYRNNASKLHQTVGEIIRTDFRFSGYKNYQEYHVKYINPNFKSFREKFDWVIPDLFLIIECHGAQHYKPTSFGKEESTPEENLIQIKERDELKKNAALEAGWSYLEIKYSDIKLLDGDYIWNLYLSLKNDNPLKDFPKKEKPVKVKKKQKLFYDKVLAKKKRKEQYQKHKQWLLQREEGEKNNENKNK